MTRGGVVDQSAVGVLVRPNGKTYRPRKAQFVAHAWSNGDVDDEGVVIFGTLDPEAAQGFADEMCGYWYGRECASDPRPGWWRNRLDNGEPTWLADEERWRPGVMFTADHSEARR